MSASVEDVVLVRRLSASAVYRNGRETSCAILLRYLPLPAAARED